MSHISTHVLDTSRGRPASGVPASLELHSPDDSWKLVSQGKTDADGRLKFLFPPRFELAPGTYRILFDTQTYFRSQDVSGFYPSVTIAFNVRDAMQNYHVPLLLSPYGYSTYRGS